MESVIVTLVTSFIGGALGGALGVWLAWRKIRGEVMTRLGDRVLAEGPTGISQRFQEGPKAHPGRRE